MASPLVLDFNSPGGTPQLPTMPLVESGQNFLEQMVQIGNNSSDQLDLLSTLYKIEYKPEWSRRKNTNYTHSITINMDPSLMEYDNSMNVQFPLLIRCIKDHIHKLKNILVVYERGMVNNKLHFHMLVRSETVCAINMLVHTLKSRFGKSQYAIKSRRINPNKGETLKQNCDRIIKYYQKEEHNKKAPLLSMVKR